LISTTTDNLGLVPDSQDADGADDSGNGVDRDAARIRRRAGRCRAGPRHGQQLGTGLVNAAGDGPGHQQAHEYLLGHSRNPVEITFLSFAAASHHITAEYVEEFRVQCRSISAIFFGVASGTRLAPPGPAEGQVVAVMPARWHRATRRSERDGVFLDRNGTT
jgi:hypothetical protein